MRISDWSSDVCSSDLAERPRTVRPGSDADQPQASLDAAAAGNDAVGSIAHAFGNEQLFGLFQPIVETSGGPEPKHVPISFKFDAIARVMGNEDFGLAIRQLGHLLVSEHDAARMDPFCMLAAAAIHPVAADHQTGHTHDL